MSSLTVRVENGRIVLDEPTDLPEGTVLRLVVDNDEEELALEPFAGLSPEESADREARLARSWAQAKAGQRRDAREISREIRARYER